VGHSAPIQQIVGARKIPIWFKFGPYIHKHEKKLPSKKNYLERLFSYSRFKIVFFFILPYGTAQ
jgi:hypothetical protein